jgi:hypothetical protein
MKGDDGDSGDGGDAVLMTFNKNRFDTQNSLFLRELFTYWQSIPAIPIIPTIS